MNHKSITLPLEDNIPRESDIPKPSSLDNAARGNLRSIRDWAEKKLDEAGIQTDCWRYLIPQYFDDGSVSFHTTPEISGLLGACLWDLEQYLDREAKLTNLRRIFAEMAAAANQVYAETNPLKAFALGYLIGANERLYSDIQAIPAFERQKQRRRAKGLRIRMNYFYEYLRSRSHQNGGAESVKYKTIRQEVILACRKKTPLIFTTPHNQFRIIVENETQHGVNLIIRAKSDEKRKHPKRRNQNISWRTIQRLVNKVNKPESYLKVRL